MTDKQIIIDGIDVSGCETIDNNSGWCGLWEEPCAKNPDCIHKKYLRKEQECEELKRELHKNFEEKDTLHLIIDRLLEASGYNTNTASAEDFEDVYENMRYEKQQLDQLKAENDKYSLFIEKLCDYAGLECDSEEQAMRTLSDFASQMNKARWIIDRYKQTLTEIKEIAEKRNYLDYNECLDDILQKISEVLDVRN